MKNRFWKRALALFTASTVLTMSMPMNIWTEQVIYEVYEGLFFYLVSQ